MGRGPVGEPAPFEIGRADPALIATGTPISASEPEAELEPELEPEPARGTWMPPTLPATFRRGRSRGATINPIASPRLLMIAAIRTATIASCVVTMIAPR